MHMWVYCIKSAGMPVPWDVLILHHESLINRIPGVETQIWEFWNESMRCDDTDSDSVNLCGARAYNYYEITGQPCSRPKERNKEKLSILRLWVLSWHRRANHPCHLISERSSPVVAVICHVIGVIRHEQCNGCSMIVKHQVILCAHNAQPLFWCSPSLRALNCHYRGWSVCCCAAPWCLAAIVFFNNLRKCYILCATRYTTTMAGNALGLGWFPGIQLMAKPGFDDRDSIQGL